MLAQIKSATALLKAKHFYLGITSDNGPEGVS